MFKILSNRKIAKFLLHWIFSIKSIDYKFNIFTSNRSAFLMQNKQHSDCIHEMKVIKDTSHAVRNNSLLNQIKLYNGFIQMESLSRVIEEKYAFIPFSL